MPSATDLDTSVDIEDLRTGVIKAFRLAVAKPLLPRWSVDDHHRVRHFWGFDDPWTIARTRTTLEFTEKKIKYGKRSIFAKRIGGTSNGNNSGFSAMSSSIDAGG